MGLLGLLITALNLIMQKWFIVSEIFQTNEVVTKTDNLIILNNLICVFSLILRISILE